jgi:cytochrome c553
MRVRGAIARSLLAAVLLACALPAAAIDPGTLASRGGPGIPPCSGCHGVDGGGQLLFPRLAGLSSMYMVKQLDDFSSGTRANAVMRPIASALSPTQRQAIAGYYAAMPIPVSVVPGAPAAGSPGAVLAGRGRWSKGVPACVQCHGPGGVGVGDGFPALAAQPAAYLAAQLHAWQAGTRRNDPLELMRHVVAPLDDSDIQSVAEWFAAQPASPATTTP